MDLLNELLYGWKSDTMMAEFPYDEYHLYKVFHKKEKRWYAQLVKGNKRTTISWARYLMSVKLERFLTDNEEVDHKDENKQNDEIDNLQLLTGVKNREKHNQENPKEMIQLVCPICGSHFERTKQQVTFKINNGGKPCCSQRCGGIHSHS